jgi:hypothetical protein
MANRLLILACSQRKRSDPGLLPAIERYDGPQFQVLRKFCRELPDTRKELNLYVVSARFGLIRGSELIPAYDYKMTKGRAQTLCLQTLKKFKTIIEQGSYDELFFNLGQSYLEVLSGYENLIPSRMKVFVAQGSVGRRQGELRDWLYKYGLLQAPSAAIHQGEARLRGIEITLSRDEVLALARKKLNDNHQGAGNYQVWYVQVDEKRVAPKWLVSQLTGLPVSSFHSGEARRMLQQLGVEVGKA